jgi:CDP-paratose 2-epimerase
MSSAGDRPVLITGGAGFIGCNIAHAVAREGHMVLVYDSLARPGVERNLAWIKAEHGKLIRFVQADVRDRLQLVEAVRDAKAIFHMAAQVAVTTSLEESRADFEINACGTLNLLEAARMCTSPPPIVFASTNKVYGDLGDLVLACGPEGYCPADNAIRTHGVSESRPLDFHTPYGCSKGAADQYVLDYARSFGLPAAVLRMSCIYGERQMGTEDQGWVAHFLIQALIGRPIVLYGDGHQVRDILDVSDAVEAYLAAWRRIDRISGRAFNLGGGPANAVSLRTLLDHVARLTGRKVDLRLAGWRAGDQRYFVADTRAAEKALNLGPRMPWRRGVARLARWLAKERGIDGAIVRPPAAAAQPQGAAL